MSPYNASQFVFVLEFAFKLNPTVNVTVGLGSTCSGGKLGLLNIKYPVLESKKLALVPPVSSLGITVFPFIVMLAPGVKSGESNSTLSLASHVFIFSCSSCEIVS